MVKLKHIRFNKTNKKYVFPLLGVIRSPNINKITIKIRLIQPNKNNKSKTHIYNSYVPGSGIGASNITTRRLKKKFAYYKKEIK